MEVIATDAQRKKRYDLCKECENFLKLIKVCKICGCFMPAKTALLSSECPMDPPKWGVIDGR